MSLTSALGTPAADGSLRICFRSMICPPPRFSPGPRSLQQAPDPGQRYCDPVRAVVEFVTELVAGLLELEGRAGPPRRLGGSRQEVLRALAGRHHVAAQKSAGGQPLPGLEGGTEPGTPGFGQGGERGLDDIVERAQHTRPAAQRTLLAAALVNGSRRLAFEVDHDEAVGRLEHLAQMVVAVTANLVCGAIGERD